MTNGVTPRVHTQKDTLVRNSFIHYFVIFCCLLFCSEDLSVPQQIKEFPWHWWLDSVRLEPSVSSVPSPRAVWFGIDRILHIYHAGVERACFVILGLSQSVFTGGKCCLFVCLTVCVCVFGRGYFWPCGKSSCQYFVIQPLAHAHLHTHTHTDEKEPSGLTVMSQG